MSTLKLTPTYFNDYEAAYHILSNNSFFVKNDWMSSANSGELDQYITLLANTDKIEDAKKFYSDYNYDFADDKTRKASLYNEIFGDRTNVDEERERPMLDANGNYILDESGKPKMEKFKASDYDYYKTVIKEINDANYQKMLAQQEQERKDSLDAGTKIFSTIAGIGTEFALGVVNQLDNLFNSLAAITAGIDASIKGTNISDAMVQTNASNTWRFFEQLGVQDWIIDFEKRYSAIRDASGNYSSVGKYIGGVASSLGQMVPSILIGKGVGKFVGPAGGIASKLPTMTSSLVFYQGITAGNVREMYEQMAAMDVSVPTAEILTNAGIKSALEYGVEVGLGKIVGGSALDNIVFGRGVSVGAAKSLQGAAGKRLLHDFIEEGLEEVFQDTSNFLVDRVYMTLINENFGEMTDISAQSLMDAFIIGGLASIAGSGLKIAATRKEVTAEGKKLSKLASWEYGLDIQSFIENFITLQNEIDVKFVNARDFFTIKDVHKNEEARKYAAAFTEMYAAYRLITSVYENIGEERFQAANRILNEATQLIKKGKFNIEKTTKLSNELVVNLELIKADAELTALIKEADMTEAVAEVSEDTIDDIADLTDNDKVALRALFESGKITKESEPIRSIVITKDGKSSIKYKDYMFIPQKYLKNGSPKQILTTTAEQIIVDNVINGKYKGMPLDTVLDLYRKIYGNKDATIEDAIYHLLFEPSFCRAAISSDTTKLSDKTFFEKTLHAKGDKDIYNFMLTLKKIIDATSTDIKELGDKSTFAAAVYDGTLARILNNMKIALKDYLINQPYAVIDAELFTETEQREISLKRWSKNLYYRVVTDKGFSELTEADKTVIRNRINGLNMSAKDKVNIYNAIFGTKNTPSTTSSRQAAMNKLNLEYKNAFMGNYNGIIYMQDTTIPNKVLNVFLQQEGITLKTIFNMEVSSDMKVIIGNNPSFDEVFNYWNNRFNSFSNGEYTLKYENAPTIDDPTAKNIVVLNAKTNKEVGFSIYNKDINAANSLTFDNDIINKDKEVLEPASGEYLDVANMIFNKLLSNNVDQITALGLSITDVIVNQSLLKKDIRDKIKEVYGRVNEQTTYLYLQQYYLNNSGGNLSLVVLNNGEYGIVRTTIMGEMVNPARFSNVIKKGNGKVLDIFTNDAKTQFSKYGRISDLSLEITNKMRDQVFYNPVSNVIYISKNIADSSSELYLMFAILHEFQHALQDENQMNLGMDMNWLYKLNSVAHDTSKKIIEDVKKHRGELFVGIENLPKAKQFDAELSIVNDFVYYCSGESMAYGMDTLYTENNAKIIDFYPVIFNNDTITFPWGSQFNIKNNRFDRSIVIHNLENKNGSGAIRELLPIVNKVYTELNNKEYNPIFDSSDTINTTNLLPNKNYTSISEDFNKLLDKDTKLLSDNEKKISITYQQINEYLNKLSQSDYNGIEKLKQDIMSNIIPAFKNVVWTNLYEKYNFSKLGISYKDFLNSKLSVVCLQTDTASTENFILAALADNTVEYLFNSIHSDQEIEGEYADHNYVYADYVKVTDILYATDNELFIAEDALHNSEPFVVSYRYDEKSGRKIILNTNEYQTGLGDITSADIRSFADTPKKRYVKQSESVGTNLEKYGYTAKYKRTQLDPSLKKFIVNATDKIDETLWNKVRSGKITTTDIMDYFRDTSNMNQATFDLINDSFFNNKYIKSFEQLEEFVKYKSAEYYAARTVLREAGFTNELIEDASPDLFDKFVALIPKSQSLKKLYDKIVERYYGSEGKEVSKKYLRTSWMRYFDGSIESGAHASSIAKSTTRANYLITGETTSRVTSSIDQKTSDDLVLGDMFADKSAEQDYIDIFENKSRKEKILEILKIQGPAYFKKMYATLHKKYPHASNDKIMVAINNKLAEIEQAFQDMSDEEFAKQYAKIVKNMSADEIDKLFRIKTMSEELGIDITKLSSEQLKNFDNVVAQTQKIVRTSAAINNNIASLTRTINRNLNDKAKKLFLKENSELFEIHDGKLKVKPELTGEIDKNGRRRLFAEDILLSIEQRVSDAVKWVKTGAYNSTDTMKLKKSFDKEINKIKNERRKEFEELLNEKHTKTSTVTIIVSDDEITIDTDREIPRALSRILENTFTSTAASKTKYLTNDTDRHVQMNMKKFLKDNDSLLNSLTQADVDDIIDFYLNSDILPSTNKARQYLATQLYLLTFLLKGNRLGHFTLTEEQVSAVDARIEMMVSTSAAIVGTWKSALKNLKPEEIIIRSLAAKCDINFSPDDVANLVNSISTGNIAEIEKAKQVMYEHALKEYKGLKTSVFTKLLKFERTAMLSGPGTAIRNLSSNYLVKGGNLVGEKIGSYASKLIDNIFTVINNKSKKIKLGTATLSEEVLRDQYTIIGTKVNEDIRSFIKTTVIDTGLLKLIRDGISKYDTRRHNNTLSDNEELALLIAESVKSEVFQEHTFKSQTLNKAHKLIMKMLSDDPFINKDAIRYFGKILAEDNIDITNGFSADVRNALAEAYKLAAYNYMHKQNFFNKLEVLMKEQWGEGAFFMYKQIFPFAAASWNWFVEGLRYTPIGLAKAIYDYAKLENTINKLDDLKQRGNQVVSSRFASYLVKRNLGKGIIGSIGMAIGIALAALGFARIDDEDDKYKLYISIGGDEVYIDITDIFGTQGIMLGISMISGFRDKNWFSAMGDTLDAMFLDSTFSDMFNSFRYSENFGEWLLNQPYGFLQMFIPNFVKTFSSIANKYKVKYTPGILGNFERLAVSAIPGLAYAFPKRVDPYTGENQVMYKAWFITNLANKLLPFNVYPYNVSDAEKEAIALGVKKSPLRGNYSVNNKNVQLTSKEIEAVNEYYGTLNKTELDSLMQNKKSYRVFDSDKNKYIELKYSKMTDKQKKTVIERIMSDNSQIAKIYILTSTGKYKYYANDSEYVKLKKLGISNIYKKTPTLDGFIER